MTDVGDEFAPGVFQLPHAGEIVEDNDRTLGPAFAVEDGGGVDFELARLGAGQFDLRAQPVMLGLEPLDERGQYGRIPRGSAGGT